MRSDHWCNGAAILSTSQFDFYWERWIMWSQRIRNLCRCKMVSRVSCHRGVGFRHGFCAHSLRNAQLLFCGHCGDGILFWCRRAGGVRELSCQLPQRAGGTGCLSMHYTVNFFVPDLYCNWPGNTVTTGSGSSSTRSSMLTQWWHRQIQRMIDNLLPSKWLSLVSADCNCNFKLSWSWRWSSLRFRLAIGW